MDRKLSLRRVLALDAAPLARYLGAILSRDHSSLPHDTYLKPILTSLIEDAHRSPAVRVAAGDLRSVLAMAVTDPRNPALSSAVVRRAAVLREALFRAAGVEIPMPHAPGEGHEKNVSSGQAHPLSVVVWIPHVRSPFNVGNMLRTCAAYGVAGVVLGEAVPDLHHPRLRRAAMGAGEMVPVVRGELGDAHTLLGGELPEVVALETGGTEISRFPFPERGVLVVGHEELGIPAEILGECRDRSRVVTIPHDGPKTSLNVGVAAGICLSWWQARSATD
jgi:TrmH family RNA methyltransferase